MLTKLIFIDWDWSKLPQGSLRNWYSNFWSIQDGLKWSKWPKMAKISTQNPNFLQNMISDMLSWDQSTLKSPKFKGSKCSGLSVPGSKCSLKGKNCTFYLYLILTVKVAVRFHFLCKIWYQTCFPETKAP